MDKNIIKQHGLSDEEYKAILKYLGREPNLVELGIFSVMWSEHCSYKSSRVHLKKFPTTGPQVICGPGENAGIVDIGDGQAIVFKMESHNHPSFIEPYQGAATGVGGILRDVFTMGARPIALLDSLRFGAANHAKTPQLVNGVVAGIAGYGNCMGIPTVGGEVYFDESYNGNILVNVMCVGLVKKHQIFRAKASGVGNPVIYVGSKTGRDGIHGATMASDVFDEGSEEKRPTVQVGDPFTEKLLLEACLELMQSAQGRKDVVGIQDMGAAGLTSSSVEMAGRGGVGFEMDLAKVPLRETGMTPYEIMLSESQERMLLVAKKGSEKRIKAFFEKWDLDSEVIGTVVKGGQLSLKVGDELVADLPTIPLTEKAPLYKRPIKKPAWQEKIQELDLATIPLLKDWQEPLLKLLASPSLASKQWVYRQFDHMVGIDTVMIPGGDAAVLRLKGTHKGIAMTTDCNSRYCYLDPFEGGKMAVAEAARNLVCVGAKPLAATDCLNFGNPEKPEIMWQFEQAVLGIAEACRVLGTPIVSGNVSLYNETKGEAIYPTPTIGMVGLLENVEDHCQLGFQQEGDLVVLLGELSEELGGSEYLKVIHGLTRGLPPRVSLDLEKRVQQLCLAGIHAHLIGSAHDCSEGGLAVALAESCFPRELGVEVQIGFPLRPDALLFAETAGRVVVSVKERDLPAFLEMAREVRCPAVVIGKVTRKNFVINQLIQTTTQNLKQVWARGFETSLGV